MLPITRPVCVPAYENPLVLGITIFKCLTVTSTFRIKGLLMIAFPVVCPKPGSTVKTPAGTGSLDHKFHTTIHHASSYRLLLRPFWQTQEQ